MTPSGRRNRLWRRGPADLSVEAPEEPSRPGLWERNREQILGAVRQLPRLPWALRLVVDEHGQDTGFAIVRGRVSDAERAAFETVASTHRLIGVMEWWAFPRPEYSWAGESYGHTPGEDLADPYELAEVAACEAWAHGLREPAAFLPLDKPHFAMSLPDFVDIAAVREAAFGLWPDTPVPKRWDVVASFSDERDEELGANWSLARQCVDVLARELGLRVLLLGRTGIPDVPDLPNVKLPRSRKVALVRLFSAMSCNASAIRFISASRSRS